MGENSIVDQIIRVIEVADPKEGTHFSICKNGKIRYLVELNNGKKLLAQNLSSYSIKMSLFIFILTWMPIKMMKRLRICKYVNVSVDDIINENISSLGLSNWNLIVGTYNEKQKLVFQCFDNIKSVFIKVGNDTTYNEMNKEIRFLSQKNAFSNFEIPKLIKAVQYNLYCPYTIQITEAFFGDRVQPTISNKIFELYCELSSIKKNVDGVELELSHGDFAPWNIRKTSNGYIIFDWENCDYRIKGFDILHYIVVVLMMLKGKSLNEAIEIGINEIKKFDEKFEINVELFIIEYSRLRL